MTIRLSDFLRRSGDVLLFWCPACDCAHPVKIPMWTWNGDAEKPTFTPSVLCTGRTMTDEGRAQFDADCAAGIRHADGYQYPSRETICHSFVTNGDIIFEVDSNHGYAGQRMPLARWPLESAA